VGTLQPPHDLPALDVQADAPLSLGSQDLEWVGATGFLHSLPHFHPNPEAVQVNLMQKQPFATTVTVT
jgi:hypothetical protein